MTKIIDAKAVISAADNTGSVFDKIAAKFKGIEKTAKAMEGIRPFKGDMFKELERLKLSEKELQGVRKSYEQFHDSLKANRPKAEHYFRAINDWQGQQVEKWRQVRAAVNETDKAHEKFFKRAGKHLGPFAQHAAMHAVGIGSAVYGAAHAAREVAHGVGERGRAVNRYEQMGLGSLELDEGNQIASAISSKFPSISRTEVLDYMRANTSRLGSWDRAKEVAEPYARALIANKISGGDEHEMEQVVRALEGMGKANTAGQLTQGLNAFARAKAANPDYTGEQFRSDMAAASASKYALSQDYMENVFPILASHTTGFGNKMATGLSALVGGRMTKASKASLREAGLIGKDGKLLDEEGYIADNFKWAQDHLKPILEKRGVHFSEHMSEDDKSKVVSFLTKSFSARNASDLMLTNLLDAPLVEKGRERRTADLGDMDRLQKKDPMLVWEGMFNQLKDAAIALAGTEPALKAMNAVSNSFSNMAKTAETGHVPENTNLGRIIAAGARGMAAVGPQSVDDLERDRLQARIAGTQRAIDNNVGDEIRARMASFNAQQALFAHDSAANMPPIFTDAEIERMRQQDQAERIRRGDVPLPRSRPSAADDGVRMPPVQTLDGTAQPIAQLQGTAEVKGEAEMKITVEPSQWFVTKFQQLENVIRLVGSLNANGPGSSGKSSPDTAAPATGFMGVP